jgi:FKBP-type peptidyl-prolyl cis-trans isomerase SlyD
MKITKNTVVTMHYSVSDNEDTLIDSSYDHDPLAIIQGTGYMIKGLETALEGHVTGDKFEVEVSADDAYGQRHDGFVQTLPKETFAGIDDLQVGSQLRATTDEGEQTVIVVNITDDEITVDGNHPLAGIDLKFEVDILNVRAATEEELAHGHVHTATGCGHNHDEHSHEDGHEDGHEDSGCCGGKDECGSSD